MDKNYYYLSGMHRTGNTVLSALLNQNPNVYSSPLSPVVQYMWVLQNCFYTMENDIRLKDKSGQERVMKSLLPSFYENVNKPIIFDRHKQWATPPNIEMLRNYIDPNPKIIFTVRPLLEIILSYINAMSESLDYLMAKDGWIIKPYLSELDNKCDYLMRPDGVIYPHFYSLISIHDEKNKNNIHLVEYDNLVNSPQETMNKIYDFIGIDHFNHNFNNIKKLETENHFAIDLPSTIKEIDKIHEIRKSLSKTSKDPKDVFSEYVINQYGSLDFWK
jgi:sulfotransferase